MKRDGWLRNLILIIGALALSALVVGCSSGDVSAPQVAGDRAPQEESAGFPANDEAGPADADDDRMVIRTKVLRLEVDNTPEAIDQVRDQTRAHGGTVSDMKVATDSDERLYHYDENGYPVGDGEALRGWITVRVPTGGYEDFVEQVSEIGIVKYQSEATDDVTQQHVDMSARLDNLRAQEARLREFFEAAENVTEMLAIEEELGRIRGEIESLDAQVTHLERQAAMATISIEMTEPRAVVPGESWGFAEAIRDGVRGAASVVTGLLTFVISTSPLWILALVLFFPIRAIVRRRRNRGPQFPPPEGQPSPSRATAAQPVGDAASEPVGDTEAVDSAGQEQDQGSPTPRP